MAFLITWMPYRTADQQSYKMGKWVFLFDLHFVSSCSTCATQPPLLLLNFAGRSTFDSSRQMKVKRSLQAGIPYIWHANTSSFLIIPQVVALETAK